MTCEFKTSDANLAAYLLMRNYSLLYIEDYHKKKFFKFPPEAALSAEAFYDGATAPAKNLFYAVKRLKFLENNLNRRKVNEICQNLPT